MLKILALNFLITLSVCGFEQESHNTFINKIEVATDLIKNNKIEESEIFVRKIINSQKTVNDKIKTCYTIAIIYNNNLYYDMSLEYALEGLDFLNEDSYLNVELNHILIINHLDLKNYDLAEAYYWQSTLLNTKKKRVEANGYNLIGEIYRLSKKTRKSIKFYHEAININQKHSYNDALTINYNNIGLSYLDLENIDSASYFLNKSLELIKKSNLINRNSAINISFGELYLKKENYQTALNYYTKTIAFDLGDHPDEYEVIQDAYKGMMICYELLGDYKNALSNHKKYNEYKLKIFNQKKNAAILQKQILLERTSHTKEVGSIESKLLLEKKYNKVILFVSGILILLVMLILYTLRINYKKVKQKIELELNKNRIQDLEIDKMKLTQERLESELLLKSQNEKIKGLERSRLEEKIQTKNRELTSTAIHIMSKNEILTQIQEKITQIKDGTENPHKIFKEIIFLISDSLRLDEDWQIFKKHFTDVHPFFLEKLKKDYPELTTDELKLCAYLKIQLSSKEIARLINITIAAVNKRRNRLRKKLEIEANEDFYDFFLNRE